MGSYESEVAREDLARARMFDGFERQLYESYAHPIRTRSRKVYPPTGVTPRAEPGLHDLVEYIEYQAPPVSYTVNAPARTRPHYNGLAKEGYTEKIVNGITYHFAKSSAYTPYAQANDPKYDELIRTKTGSVAQGEARTIRDVQYQILTRKYQNLRIEARKIHEQLDGLNGHISLGSLVARLFGKQRRLKKQLQTINHETELVVRYKREYETAKPQLLRAQQ